MQHGNCTSRVTNPPTIKSNIHINFYTNVHSSISHNILKLEAIQRSTSRWVGKQKVVYLYNRILLSNRKTPVIHNLWVNLKNIMLSPTQYYLWSQTYNKYRMVSSMCNFEKHKVMEAESGLVVACGSGESQEWLQMSIMELRGMIKLFQNWCLVMTSQL